MDKEKLFEVAEEMWPTNKDLPPYHWVNTEAKRKQGKWLDGALWTLTILQSRLAECERERDELRKEMDAIKDAIEGNPETLNQLRKDEHFTEDKANKFIEPEKVLFAIWALARMLHGTLQTMHSKECLNEIRELTKLKQ